MRIVRLGTSQNQGDRGKSREGRPHCRLRAGLGAGGTAVGLHSQGRAGSLVLCKEPASLFWPWLWLCAYSWSRPCRPLQASACEAEADPAQQHLDSGTGKGCRAAVGASRGGGPA